MKNESRSRGRKRSAPQTQKGPVKSPAKVDEQDQALAMRAQQLADEVNKNGPIQD